MHSLSHASYSNSGRTRTTVGIRGNWRGMSSSSARKVSANRLDAAACRGRPPETPLPLGLVCCSGIKYVFAPDTDKIYLPGHR